MNENESYVIQEAIADSTPISEAEFAAQFARARFVDNSWSGNLDVLPEQAVH